ncbi:MAG: PilT/PilU family type 4a pilus ATPase [Armatimonadetes bacterium]|nr:PilT/PilU family type 4a pilus ATPase [Armatimonadota bacterium]MDW8120985.1 PilT/PilU family type 4a pilus ATPase [Armatimonadota bacterium]
MIDLEKLIRYAVEVQASDIFLKVGSPPCLRVHGKVVPMDSKILTVNDMKAIASAILTEEQMASFEKRHELDLGFTFPGICRFRINVYQQRGTLAIEMRVLPLRIRSIEELNLPLVLKRLVTDTTYPAYATQGLILVTGPTGCGKSTTLAAMLDLILQTRQCHLITIEDPIEYVYEDKLGIVSQREVGSDTASFLEAIKYAMRESPDVILIGEMRDPETFEACLRAAETGHLVFSTVHTPSASETMERIVNMFPPHDRPMVCQRLSRSLVAILSQKLVPRADGQGRLPACEILIVTPTVAKEIEEMKTGNLYGLMVRDKQEGGYWGMQTMNQALEDYVRQELITPETALRTSPNPSEMRHILHRVLEEKRRKAEEAEKARRAALLRQVPRQGSQ